ncbi:type IV pilus modification PilV family protein [Marinicella meishanensis]|uniref:type IV pilus modification PilV family protein n=1 Tax=Marinicella meishanensis TaxID=2873263 RepID=UPI001CBD207A|nr:prepilin-type N-terminal cleavage/methylation domain-containing protein [Marinicella sp. NBU2979]
MPNNRRRHQGFTLIEVIASFTILAMTFMVILEVLSNSSTNTIKSSERSKIALLAQSKMDEVGLIIPIEEGSESGSFDDEVDWNVSIVPYEVPYDGNVQMDFAPVDLYKVNLTLSWLDGRGQRRSADFVTLRAMTADYSQSREVGR